MAGGYSYSPHPPRAPTPISKDGRSLPSNVSIGSAWYIYHRPQRHGSPDGIYDCETLGPRLSGAAWRAECELLEIESFPPPQAGSFKGLGLCFEGYEFGVGLYEEVCLRRGHTFSPPPFPPFPLSWLPSQGANFPISDYINITCLCQQSIKTSPSRRAHLVNKPDKVEVDSL